MASAPREVYGDLATTAFVEASLLFKSLDEEARRDVVHLARVVTFAKGELVSAEGDDGFYLVRDGAAAVLATAPAGPVEVAVLERGAFFGVSRVLGAPQPWRLVARSPLAVVVFPTAVLAALVERFPRMRKLLEAILAARAKEAAQRLAS